MAQAALIHGFEEARAEATMHTHREADDPVDEFGIGGRVRCSLARVGLMSG
jgi:hypothetical protein